MSEGEVLTIDALPRERGDRLVAHAGVDPRALAAPHRRFRASPRRLRARREVTEPARRGGPARRLAGW
jgi:hypothetical protein